MTTLIEYIVKIRPLYFFLIFFLFPALANAQASASEAAGFRIGQILGPLFIAFIVWRLIKYANQQNAYKQQIEQRRKAREAQSKMDDSDGR